MVGGLISEINWGHRCTCASSPAAQPIRTQRRLSVTNGIFGFVASEVEEVNREAVDREACERFAAGYIQCMHDVHTFVSSCPGIDPTVAAELLNHLLESMPLNDQDRLRVMLPDSGAEFPGSSCTWPTAESIYLGSPAPSSSFSSDDLCSDLDETDSEQSHVSSSEEADSQDVLPPLIFSKSVWRPW